MSTSIPSHLSVHEINQHKLDVEYKHWISRITFFEVELDFYERLLSSGTFNQQAVNEIFDQLLERRKINKDTLAKVHKYRNNLEGYRECEDLECDNFYLNDHEDFRIELEQHAEEMREFKSRIFQTVLPNNPE